jgi:hypothetical protein
MRAIQQVEAIPARNLLWVVLSDLVRVVSQQEPRDLRVRRRKEPIADAPLFALLTEKLLLELEKLGEGEEILVSRRNPLWRAEVADVRGLSAERHELFSRRLADAVVTSPPYATALPYIDTERLSFLVLGLANRSERSLLERKLIGSREFSQRDRLLLEEEMMTGGLKSLPSQLVKDLSTILAENRQHAVGFRRRNLAALLYRYFRDMRTSLRNIAKVVRPGGKLFFVLGDGRTKLGSGRWYPIRTCSHVSALASQVGLEQVEKIPITVTTEDLAHAKNSITDNEILVFRRSI